MAQKRGYAYIFAARSGLVSLLCMSMRNMSTRKMLLALDFWSENINYLCFPMGFKFKYYAFF